jgi:hypothetical protein
VPIDGPDSRRLSVAVMTALVATAVLGPLLAPFPGSIGVAAVSCEDGVVDELTLRTDYEGDEPVTVTAHVWSERQHVQFAWEPTRVRVVPGEQTVHLEAPDDRAVTKESRAQVWLASVDGRRAVENFDVVCPNQKLEGRELFNG